MLGDVSRQLDGATMALPSTRYELTHEFGFD
jgi:hypothetical protein